MSNMKYYFVKIHSNSQVQLHELQKIFDIDLFRQTARKLNEELFEIQGLLSEEQIQEVRAKDYQVEVIYDAGKIARERLRDID